jgi:hypothetical protein
VVSAGLGLLDTALYLDASACLARARQINARVRPGTFEDALASARAARCDLCLRNFAAGYEAIQTTVAILDRPRDDDEVYLRVLAEVTHARSCSRWTDRRRRAARAHGEFLCKQLLRWRQDLCDARGGDRARLCR